MSCDFQPPSRSFGPAPHLSASSLVTRHLPLVTKSPVVHPLSSFSSSELRPLCVSALSVCRSTLNFQLLTLFSASRHTLLRSRSQRILFLLTEDSDAHRCGREVVYRRNYFHNYFLRFCERAAVRSKTLFRNALALHRSVSRRPHRRYLD